MIKRHGRDWIVTSSKGRVLGTHRTYDEALAQLRAVEASKARRRGIRSNPLLSKPPQAHHRLQAQTESLVRPHMREDVQPWEGVHTSDSYEIAAAYAWSAWQRQPGGRGAANRYNYVGYPVVLHLDVGGLDAEPDVDSVLVTQNLDLHTVWNILDKHEEVWSMADAWNEWEGAEQRAPQGPVDSLLNVATDANPFQAALNAAHDDEKEARRLLEEWRATGKQIPPHELLVHILPQTRWLHDFEEDRLLGIDLIQPWFPELIPEDQEENIEAAEADGWLVITKEEAYETIGDVRVNAKKLYAPLVSGDRHIEFHGTATQALSMAFPDVMAMLDQDGKLKENWWEYWV